MNSPKLCYNPGEGCKSYMPKKLDAITYQDRQVQRKLDKTEV
jgi:hypothetical protein